MELINIKGNTFYIKGGTNTGVYLYNGNNLAIIIDPGLSGLRPKKIIKLLQENNITPRYIINTHEHNDHFGGCSYIKEIDNNIQILSSYQAKLYIENQQLFSTYIMGGKSNNLLNSKLKNNVCYEVKIDKTLEEGIYNIDNTKLNIIDFKGHTCGSIGVLTEDKVLFVGDLLIGKDMLDKFDFLFLFDIKEQIKSLDKLESIEFEYLVLGHSKEVISKQNSYYLITKNRECIKKYIKQIKKDLESPTTLENLLKNIIKDNNLSCNYKEYHFFKSSLVSMISYLIDLDEVDYLLKDGEMLYYTKRN